MKRKLLDPDKIHNWLAELFNVVKYKFLISGINDDDCAIIRLGKQSLVITTDFLNANPIAKELEIGSNWDLGRLLVAANLSDLCGTGAEPVAMLISLMFKKGTYEYEFKDFIKGVKYELDKHNIPLIGGDTKLGKESSFCGIAIGTSTQHMKLFLKNKARPGDLIWLSGEIGSTSAAVLGLTKYKMSKLWVNWAKRVLINPNIPIRQSREVAILKIGNGGTDISDGLGENIYDLCESSNVGAMIYASQIPMNTKSQELAIKANLTLWNIAFNVGGDFQFIVTGKKKDEQKFKELGFYCIGKITRSKEKILVLDQKKKINLPRMGHTDFNIKSFSEEIKCLLVKAAKLNK